MKLSDWAKQQRLESKKRNNEIRGKILQNNPPEFLKDLKRSRGVVVDAHKTNVYLPTLKCDVMRIAQRTEIRYTMSEDVYVIKRTVMVIY